MEGRSACRKEGPCRRGLDDEPPIGTKKGKGAVASKFRGGEEETRRE